MKITWHDLPKPKGLFTGRNTVTYDLSNKMEIVQYYSMNTKIQVAQCTAISGSIYLRTASAAEKNNDWGFSASSFDLTSSELASLAHLCGLQDSKSDIVKKSNTVKKTKTVTKKTVTPKSEVEQVRKQKLLTRLFNHFKKESK